MVGTMAKIDDSVKKKVPELRFKGFTDEWEQRKLGDEVRIVMGRWDSLLIQKIILMILMGAKNAKTYEDLFCISQTKNPKEMVYDYDHETK